MLFVDSSLTLTLFTENCSGSSESLMNSSERENENNVIWDTQEHLHITRVGVYDEVCGVFASFFRALGAF